MVTEDRELEEAPAVKSAIKATYFRDFVKLLLITWPLLLGNTLEWYEFGVYGYVEKEIAANFFGNSAVGGWLGYAITFVARPIGGFVLGWIADNWGRKLSVNLSLAGMIVATVGQGLLPGKHLGSQFQTLGLVLLVITRALQGISAGGEIGAISCYLMEVSPIQTLGMAVCMISCGSQIAWAFASAFLAYLSAWIGPDAMLVWGWRVPFLICIFPGLLALWGRNRLHDEDIQVGNSSNHTNSCEPELGLEAEEASSGTTASSISVKNGEPLSSAHLFTQYWPNLLIGFGGTVGIATMWFVPPFWTLSAILDARVGTADALWIGNSAQLIGLAITPLAGWLTDKMGVAWTLLVGATFFALTAVPVYAWIYGDPSTLSGYLGVGLFFGLAQGFSGAVIYLFVAELFPTELRSRGIAASYNIAVSFVGGFGSLICQALYASFPCVAPGAYFSATGLISVITLLCSLVLQKRGLVKLTHRRSAPYCGCAKAKLADAHATNKLVLRATNKKEMKHGISSAQPTEKAPDRIIGCEPDDVTEKQCSDLNTVR